MSKVLVVDDEKLIVKGIKFSLEQDGMEVDCAYDGEEALEYARNTEYDIVILDLMLSFLESQKSGLTDNLVFTFLSKDFPLMTRT